MTPTARTDEVDGAVRPWRECPSSRASGGQEQRLHSMGPKWYQASLRAKVAFPR